MPPAPPTCAARIIRNEPLKNGWGLALDGDTNNMVNRVKKYAKDCYVLQIDRTRAVDASSLSSAIFWEHRHLPRPLIVSTPTANYGSLFCTDKKKFNENLKDIHQHPMFGPMREREFTIWPVLVPQSKSSSDDESGQWVTIIMRTRVNVVTTGGFGHEVTDIAIVDPFQKKREPRRQWIEKKLASILAQGEIGFPETAKRRDMLTEDVNDKWATGYVSYAICREFLRRLKVLTRRRDGTKHVPIEFLWDKFEEYFNLDTYRESLMAACAHQTIEKSDYRVRMSIDVPSVPSEPEEGKKKKTNYHNSKALSHPNAERDVPDEEYSVALRRASISIKEESDSDKSEEGDSDSNEAGSHKPSSSKSSSSKPDSDESEEDTSDVDTLVSPRTIVNKPAGEKSVQAIPPSSASSSHSAHPNAEDANMGLPDYEDEYATDAHTTDTEMSDAGRLRLGSVGPESTELTLPGLETQTVIASKTTSVVDFGHGNEGERPQKHSLEDAAEGSAASKKPKTAGEDLFLFGDDGENVDMDVDDKPVGPVAPTPETSN
ncbi:hypothetical protein F4821DRAFT_276390 [Hypoxylon rubiginosum]|uniref:Uncharacterized protein n=1 Tax=Hypoxylon rubiginosum TaxID=110542 RepID=A0ACC0D9J8_9PEZI|nr:hypothetical protein F4821DRAFT_276390 [Hypoxylon rubiginosum]